MNSTSQIVYFGNSRNMDSIETESVDLVVTSPPYPMIEMWDDVFSEQNTEIAGYLTEEDGNSAFEEMHRTLDKVWEECNRVLKEQSFACINIGDATRKIGDRFKLYANHSRVTQKFHSMGFDTLPMIHWRKQTNAPSKFMGSGMLPAGAYVTLENEYILIFRKGGKRVFKTIDEKTNRQRSAFFWEERNTWFSDVWDFKGTGQKLNSEKSRDRSAAFPFELAYRLVNMYSVKGDTVLDPFLGIGTTLLATMATNRNGIGVEIDDSLREAIFERMDQFSMVVNKIANDRLQKHRDFVKEYQKKGKKLKHTNSHYGFPVMGTQERNLEIDILSSVSIKKNYMLVTYTKP